MVSTVTDGMGTITTWPHGTEEVRNCVPEAGCGTTLEIYLVLVLTGYLKRLGISYRLGSTIRVVLPVDGH